jgi:hypothetical protein
MEKISWTDRVRNKEVLHRDIKERNIIRTINIGKDKWIGYVLRRNCLLKDVSEGKIKGRIKVTGRRGRRRTELQDCLKERRGYWKLKRKQSIALCGGRGCGPIGRQTVE